MPQVEFIQVLPYGTRKKTLIDRPLEIATMADALMARGFKLESKHLAGDEVMVAIADPVLDFLLASRTVKNGPAVLEAVDGLITDVHAVMAERDAAKRKAAFL